MSSEDHESRPEQWLHARKRERRMYVLDTSVLLADPLAMTRFEEHEVVLPVVVVT
ncbi:PIN domain-containing protein, partial [Kitasatospora purpeofusca]|uniref:PIN domain-containing protein n=1 Tax=Kitasatospora purpeofusca TaxID=67352 RepID=UPI0035E18620